MKILFTKLSDEEHRVHIVRCDGSEDDATLNSRSFLRHDFAHLATEECVGLARGFWGQVAKGAGLNGTGIGGPEAQLAEALAAPIQTLMRTGATVETYEKTLSHVLPDRDCGELAMQVKERGRQLEGYWRATPYGETMEVEWLEHD
ncbi:MAG: hypothetical protein MI746_15600 [Pseudomonadales bacterium]|nr:hypothetical protein [Pseudomonadales bacterium]